MTQASFAARLRRPGLRGWAQFCALLLALASPASPLAHPSHGSYAEVEWAEGDGSALNVALRVTPEDLERALTGLAGERVVLRDTDAVRELLAVYLGRHIRWRDAPPAPLTVLGMELDYRDTWIYFSVTAPGDQQRILRNSLLMDLEPTQTNRVKRLWAPEAPVLVFSAAEPERDLTVPTK